MNALYMSAWIVLIYGFLGWCSEVVFAAVNSGKFVNRGFLNGPICPIYGFGVLIISLCLTPFVDNFFLLFLFSMVLTSALEFLTGWVLEKLFNTKWWDYTDVPFNIKGYICLKFSIIWGLACVFIMKIVHPVITGMVEKFPLTLGIILLVLLLCIFAADFGITLAAVLKFPKHMKAADELEEKLNAISEGLGKNLTEYAVDIKEKSEVAKSDIETKTQRQREVYQEKKELLQQKKELTQKRLALLREHKFIHKRLAKAFPKLQENKYKDWLEKLKNR